VVLGSDFLCKESSYLLLPPPEIKPHDNDKNNTYGNDVEEDVHGGLTFDVTGDRRPQAGGNLPA
jgi:hypothetical protein